MNRTYNEGIARKRLKEVTTTAWVFASVTLRQLCEADPVEAGNFSMRFETHPFPQFVFSKSAEKLYTYSVPVPYLLHCKNLTKKIREEWKELHGQP